VTHTPQRAGGEVPAGRSVISRCISRERANSALCSEMSLDTSSISALITKQPCTDDCERWSSLAPPCESSRQKSVRAEGESRPERWSTFRVAFCAMWERNLPRAGRAPRPMVCGAASGENCALLPVGFDADTGEGDSRRTLVLTRG